MPRVDFYSDMFDQMVEEKGMVVDWYEAMMCHCYNESTGQPDFTCKVCKGSGFIYLPPITTKVLATSLSGKMDFENIGVIQRGTAYITSLSKDLMGYHDKIVFPDFNSKYSQLISFTSDGVSERTYKPIKDVKKLISPEGEYVKDIDFVVTDDNYRLKWINPEKSVPYHKATILYVTPPSYIIIDLIHELRATWVKFKKPKDTFVELPKQYVIKREDFIYDTDNS